MKSNESVTSKTFDGITDLVIWAPIKEGFIDAFENVTYESRLHQVAEALHKIRNGVPSADMLSLRFLPQARVTDLLTYLQTLDTEVQQ